MGFNDKALHCWPQTAKKKKKKKKIKTDFQPKKDGLLLMKYKQLAFLVAR